MSKRSVCSSCGMSAEGEQKFCSVCGGAMNVTDIPDTNETPASDFIPPVMQDAMNGSTDPFADANPSASEESTPSYDDIMNGSTNTVQTNTDAFGGTSYSGASSIPNINTYNTYNNTTAPKKSNKDGLAVGGLITGIASIVLCCFNCIDIPVAIVGLVISILGLKSEAKKGCAIGGIITSIAGLLLSILMIILYLFTWTFTDEHSENMAKREGYDTPVEAIMGEYEQEMYEQYDFESDFYDYEYYYDYE